MQDPSLFQPVKLPFPEQEQLKCPRCESTNTKFCYYNNYNLSQPRHFCKNCRRYWTKGGALRNVPVGGGTRKSNTKRSSNVKRPSTPTNSAPAPPPPPPPPPQPSQDQVPNPPQVDQERKLPEISESLSSLLGTYGRGGSVLESLNQNGSGLRMLRFGAVDGNLNSGSGSGSGPDKSPGSSNISDGYLGVQSEDGSCWNNGGGGVNGWPDLAIHTIPKQ